MKYRKLRIAWSVAWGVVAVLLVVMWVRSSRWRDQLKCQCGSAHSFCVVSCRGQLAVVPLPIDIDQWLDPIGNKVLPNGLTSGHLSPTGTVMEPNGKVTLIMYTNTNRAGQTWGWSLKPIVLVSYWMLLPPVALLCCWGVAPFLRQRFSLRTLLIATALVSALLGLIVWVTGK